MPNSINILLVDDHRVVRSGIKSYFDDSDRYLVVGEASDGREALSKMKELDVQVVLTDYNMPVMDGIAMTKRLMKEFPNVKVIALTMREEYLAISKMFAAGASGYLVKTSDEEEVKEAIETVLAGDKYQCAAIQQVILDYVSKANAFSKDMGNRLVVEAELSDREVEVLRLIVTEYSNQEIADKLFISVRTVDSHKRNLLEKTGARNAVGLVRYALSKGLID